MKSVIVTGGCGFIGTKLVKRLVEDGNYVIVIDKSAPLGYADEVSYISKELGRDLPLPEFDNVDIVYHLAAEARVQKTYNEPLVAHDNNTRATLEVLEAARTYGVNRVVYASTSSVYRNYSVKTSLKETENICPVNPYGISKLQGEQWCRFYGTNTSIDTVCLRFFNVYGEGQSSDGPYAQVTSVFLDQIKKGIPLTINGKGTQTRDFTYVDDIVEGIILAGECTSHEFKGMPINLGRGQSHSIFNLAQHFSKSYIFNPPKPGENPHDLADNSRAKHMLGWEPTVNVIEWMESQV